MDDSRSFPPPPTAASAEEALRPPAPPAEPQVSAGKGVKETIESILIAFILAFVFRAFVVEAFVIPTGSMASTLLGAHVRLTCKDCGYTFDVNFPSRSAGGDETVNQEDLRKLNASAYCQNCRFRMSTDDARSVRYGDRILVLKYLYIPWISDPQRWDVVVFKTPDSGSRSKDPPFTVNYIKRLVGLPNEELMILYGDLYKNVAQQPADAGAKRNYAWQIQTKPKHAQDALWRLIYDNDFRPLNKDRADGWTLPWKQVSGAGWDTGDADHSRVFRFDGPAGEGRLRFDSASPPRSDGPGRPAPPDYFTDWLAYDVTMGDIGQFYGLNYQVHTVTDLRLCFSYERQSGDGPLRARLTKLQHEFVLEILPDRVRLLHEVTGKPAEEIAAAKVIAPPAAGGAPLRVDFANVDYHVTVRLNGEVAFETSYSPGVEEMTQLIRQGDRGERQAPPSVAIEAERQRSAVSHVSLWRDVYYTTPSGTNGEWHNSGPGGKPSNSTRLGPDEYFVLGDNSAASSDARFWDKEVNLPEEDLRVRAGRVPGRFMLGRAFFVYWPAGYRPTANAPALVPDFGDMRLIQ
jgi:signal peptidase I